MAGKQNKLIMVNQVDYNESQYFNELMNNELQ